MTEETYGIFVYQEQVMAAASVLAGYTLGGADLLRRAMGKKDKEKMAKEREKFVEGCAGAQRHRARRRRTRSSTCWRNSRATDSTVRTPPPMPG